MSDIQELIHKTTMDCLNRGKYQEQDRIVKIIEEARSVYLEDTVSYDYLTSIIEVITGKR